MNDFDNEKLTDVIIGAMNDSESFIPDDLSDELAKLLVDAVFISPFENDMIMPIEIANMPFLPVFTNVDDFKGAYGDINYEKFKLKDLSCHLKFFMQGIVINPGTLSFIIKKRLVNMLFYRIMDDEKDAVRKGYDVKVRFKDFRPIMWRDLIIPENMTFMELDDVLKTLWNFNGEHMSAFITGNNRELIMDGDLSKETMMDAHYDSNFTLINDLFENNAKIGYWYDFTDDWHFDIEIKKIVDYDKKYVTIKRFKGEYNLIDDCGGPGRYAEIIVHSENHADYLEEFDMQYCQALLEKKSYVYSAWYESPV